MRAEPGGDLALGELMAAGDSDELCRLLLGSPWGWGSSTRHGEVVSLLRGLSGRGTFPGSLVALLLCTCHRWERVTAKLIAAIEDSGLLSGPDLDELAESLLSDEVVAVFPFAWVSREWMEFDTGDGTTRTVKISDEAITRQARRVEPPLRRWAAARALCNDPDRLAACWKEPTCCRLGTVTRCCMACSTPLAAWKRLRAVKAGDCAAVPPASAGPPWTGSASSTGLRRRCAARPPTRIARCEPGARPTS
jgi:hypothetical protein